MRVERIALEHHGDVAVARLQAVTSRSPIRTRPAVGMLEAGQDAQRRGLAAAGRPEQGQEGVVGYVEVEALNAATESKRFSTAS